MTYDLFISGPPQEYARLNYLDVVKEAFPMKRIYHSGKKTISLKDLHALKNSQAMLGFISGIPYTNIIFEAGIFYEIHKGEERLDNLVCVVPKYMDRFDGKEILNQKGHLVTEMNIAIEKLEQYFFDRDLNRIYKQETPLLNLYSWLLDKIFNQNHTKT